MIINVKGPISRPIPWSMSERKSKEYAIVIEKIPGGFVVAVPAVQYSTIVLDQEHRLIARNRIERPLRHYFDLDETKKVAKLIIDNLA